MQNNRFNIAYKWNQLDEDTAKRRACHAALSIKNKLFQSEKKQYYRG